MKSSLTFAFILTGAYTQSRAFALSLSLPLPLQTYTQTQTQTHTQTQTERESRDPRDDGANKYLKTIDGTLR